jgi:hypothetical protein
VSYRWREQKGASLVEYVLVLPLVLLLTLGTLEVFRLMAIRQSLRSGLAQALPCFTHWRDSTYRGRYDCSMDGIRARLAHELNSNPFAGNAYQLTIVKPNDVELQNVIGYGQSFEVVVEIRVKLGYLASLGGSLTPIATMRENAWTFMDSSPDYLKLDPSTPFPFDPGNDPAPP